MDEPLVKCYRDIAGSEIQIWLKRIENPMIGSSTFQMSKVKVGG